MLLKGCQGETLILTPSTHKTQDFGTGIVAYLCLQAEWEAGESGRLRRVIAAFSRPTRIVRGKEVPPASVAVDPALFEGEEEKALFAAFSEARAKVSDAAYQGAERSPTRQRTVCTEAHACQPLHHYRTLCSRLVILVLTYAPRTPGAPGDPRLLGVRLAVRR